MASTETTQNPTAKILLIALSILILFGAALSVYFLTVDKNVIEVGIKPDETQQICFDEVYLRPGEQCRYTIRLSSEYAERYRLTLKFVDHNPTLTLKNYACVCMKKDDEVLCDKLLADMFAQGSLTTAIDFTDGAKNEIEIVFYMPEDVGNEAQNAEADFTLLVTATNK